MKIWPDFGQGQGRIMISGATLINCGPQKVDSDGTQSSSNGLAVPSLATGLSNFIK